MSKPYLARLKRLESDDNNRVLTQIQRGIEKEGLRVTPKATVAQTEHPVSLGSALTHACITTDYSEALLELITPVSRGVEDSIDYLIHLHAFTLQNMGDEYFWPASMPCRLEGEESIPIAQYGCSNLGQMKHIYRQGLAHRYGRIMQSIAGIHYNFSLPEEFWPLCQSLWGVSGDLQAFKSERYFGLIRNFSRYSWILNYLFGASPALDSSFMDGKPHKLSQVSKNTLGLPFATSLRMSDLGYKSKAQDSLSICYRDLKGYVDSLDRAVHHNFPDYEKIGVKSGEEYRQLNSNLLQVENEYYSDIRPKRVTQPGERPIEALRARGVEYVEVRILDINPYLSVGIDAEQIRFLDSFLLYCLLSDGDSISESEFEEISANKQRVILEGRKPKLMLRRDGKPIAFSEAARQLLHEIGTVARLLDSAYSFTPADYNSYQHAVTVQMNKVEDSNLTPSGRMMRDLKKVVSFHQLILAQAAKQKDYFLNQQIPGARNSEFKVMVVNSLHKQRELEASNSCSFEDFLRSYWD